MSYAYILTPKGTTNEINIKFYDKENEGIR